MEHAKKMALVEPQFLESVLLPQPLTNTVGYIMHRLEEDMKVTIELKDLQERDNDMDKKHMQQLLQVAKVSDDDKAQVRVGGEMVGPAVV